MWRGHLRYWKHLSYGDCDLAVPFVGNRGKRYRFRYFSERRGCFGRAQFGKSVVLTVRNPRRGLEAGDADAKAFHYPALRVM
jgi:hypothetical protein